ncbi:SDR family NAD(P)-dependent oxidoreductase [Shewanella surugensis]|uniref:SDR family NAD(P)-dependent oxidoreductase n=1 Tax=Shewanella surugensis TaxID=212020 RepID=A0ABT0L8C4_9GAMM|nr:SDR family NAD(P)-dependent oxidoreductase [Shewanella surugensis]MCL1123426.1 SDR family NAD(P)-dependent oxidoreductase [Shewanella surugensis]
MPYALITGGNQGIGYAIACHLAQKGYDLILVAKNKERLIKAKQALSGLYPAIKISIYRCNFAHTSSVEQLSDRILRQYSPIDILVNSAGVLTTHFIEADDNTIDHLLSINLASTLILTNKVAQHMQQQQKGHIFTLASNTGINALPKIGLYGVTKAALINYSESLFKHLLPYGVKVTCLCPSVVDTNMTNDGRIDNEAKIQPDDIVKAVDFALSLSPNALLPQMTILCRPIELEKLK